MHRLKVGLVHQRVGVELKWYLGAYRLYLDQMLTGLLGDNETTRTLGSLMKAVFFDIALAIDTYSAAQHQALEDSEARFARPARRQRRPLGLGPGARPAVHLRALGEHARPLARFGETAPAGSPASTRRPAGPAPGHRHPPARRQPLAQPRVPHAPAGRQLPLGPGARRRRGQAHGRLADRHQPAQGHRAPAQPRRAARPAHRPGQPPAPGRAPAAGPAAPAQARCAPGGAAVHRPRPFQADQRQPRPRRR